MNKVFSLLAIAFGAFMVVYGGYDDSPGAQLLGLIIVIAGIVVLVKSWRKSSVVKNKTNNFLQYNKYLLTNDKS